MSLIAMQPYEFTAQGDYENDFFCRVSWADDTDNAANTSRPVITALQFKSKYWSPDAWVNGTIKADGVTIIEFSEFRGTHSVDITKGAGYSPVTANGGNPNAPWYGQPIAHGNDGFKTIALTVDVYLRFMDGGRRVDFHDERTVSLSQIPRASTVGVADGNIEGVATISVNRKSAQYTHTLQYLFGKVSGWIDADGNPVADPVKMTAASVPFHIPPTFYSQIPDARYGEGRIYCRTYSGETRIGDKTSATFNAYATYDRCYPKISTFQAIDILPETVALTGDNKKLVRGVSTVEAKISATARNSAKIVKYEINGQKASTLTVKNATSGSFYLAAEDSRGFRNGGPLEMAVVPYVKLTVNTESSRPEPTGDKVVVMVTGNFFKGNFGAKDNTLSLSYRLDSGSPVPITGITYSNGNYSAKFDLSLPYTEDHSIELIATDLLSEAKVPESLSHGLPNFEIFKNRTEFYKPVLPSGGMSDIGIFIRNDPGRKFDLIIEEVFKDMTSGTSRLIQFEDYPDTGIYGVASGFIFKNNEESGIIMAWHYNGYKLHKLRQHGAWKPWVREVI